MPHIALNGQDLYFEVLGQGDPLVLIHGYCVDHTVWMLVKNELAKHFHLILLDNRSAGRSKAAHHAFSVEDMADDVIALCNHMRLDKFHVLGHSMGGCIAQSIAYRHPERIGKAIFSQTVVKSPPVANKVLRTAIELQEEGVPLARIFDLIMPWVLSNDFIDNSVKCAYLLEKWKSNLYPPTLQGQKYQAEALRHFDSSGWYKKIAVPVQVHAAEEDLLFPMGYATELKHIPGAKLHVFKKMGHSSLLEVPEEYSHAVQAFLLNS